MTCSFMSMIVALVIERVSVRVGLWLFAPLLVLGISSVGYWRFTELVGGIIGFTCSWSFFRQS